MVPSLSWRWAFRRGRHGLRWRGREGMPNKQWSGCCRTHPLRRIKIRGINRGQLLHRQAQYQPQPRPRPRPCKRRRIPRNQRPRRPRTRCLIKKPLRRCLYPPNPEPIYPGRRPPVCCNWQLLLALILVGWTKGSGRPLGRCRGRLQ